MGRIPEEGPKRAQVFGASVPPQSDMMRILEEELYGTAEPAPVEAPRIQTTPAAAATAAQRAATFGAMPQSRQVTPPAAPLETAESYMGTALEDTQLEVQRLKETIRQMQVRITDMGNKIQRYEQNKRQRREQAQQILREAARKVEEAYRGD